MNLWVQSAVVFSTVLGWSVEIGSIRNYKMGRLSTETMQRSHPCEMPINVVWHHLNWVENVQNWVLTKMWLHPAWTVFKDRTEIKSIKPAAKKERHQVSCSSWWQLALSSAQLGSSPVPMGSCCEDWRSSALAASGGDKSLWEGPFIMVSGTYTANQNRCFSSPIIFLAINCKCEQQWDRAYCSEHLSSQREATLILIGFSRQCLWRLNSWRDERLLYVHITCKFVLIS